MSPLALDEIIFRHSMDAIFITASDGSIFRANPAACRLLLLTEEDICRLGRAGLVDPASAGLGDFLDSRAATGRARSELIFIRGDGSKFPGEVSSAAFSDDHGNARNVLVVRDLSERKEMEAALSDTQRIAHLGSWYLDWQTGATRWSEELLRIFGLDPARRPPSLDEQERHFTKESWIRLRETLKATAESGQAYELELEIIRQDGSHGWIWARGERVDRNDGSIIGMRGVAQDISEKKSTLESLKRSEAWFRSIFENTNSCIASTDRFGKLTSFNAAFRDLLGYEPAALLTLNFADITYPEDLAREKVFVDEILANNRDGYHIAKRYIKRDGDVVWVDLSAAVIRDEAGNVVNFVAVIQDITERKRSEEVIWKQANFDMLTELPNRSMFFSELDLEIKKSQRLGLKLALLYIDLDQFKEANDTLGHAVGDALLRAVGKRLHSSVRESDFVARLGGDEFIIILSELSEYARVGEIAEHILKDLSRPFQLGEETLYLSASIGITLYPDDTLDPATLLSNADQAMYAAKSEGQNHFCFFTPAFQKDALTRLRLANDLRSALSGNQFNLHFQPIVDLKTGAIRKAEALIRWNHPERGLISPAEFIPAAERNGAIVGIGDWVFAESIGWIKRWEGLRCQSDPLGGNGEACQISVNVSPRQFRADSRNFCDKWLGKMEEMDIPGEAVVIEITESLLVNAEDELNSMLGRLRKKGVQVAIDDFGTGYSSLAYIKKFDIDYLKIDQTFVRHLEIDGNDRALSEAIIVMAHKLGMKVVAEGVETEQQRHILLAAGCDYAQGYLYSKPVPPEAFEALLSARRSPFIA